MALSNYFPTFQSLLELEIDGIKSLDQLMYPGIEKLERLTVRRGTFDDMNALGVCTSLQILDISNNRWIESLEGLDKLVSLTKLTAQECLNLKYITHICNHTSKLKYLDFSLCASLYWITTLRLIPDLQSLYIQTTAVTRENVDHLRRTKPLLRICFEELDFYSDLDLSDEDL
jgi:Leucine-rich repeat (LRR) protein